LIYYKKEIIKKILTANNTNGILSYHSKDDDILIAYPHEEEGVVGLYNHKKNQISKINAQNSSIQIITFSTSGKYIATASEKGTVIKIFNVSDLSEFKVVKSNIQIN
jgi:WD40 repeat protein